MKSDPIATFNTEKKKRIDALGENTAMQQQGTDFLIASGEQQYAYNFTWLGRPIIQYPQDMIALQELIWDIKPDLIIETGIAHGGSLILSASILMLLGNGGHVLGIDIDIREHNKHEIEKHPLSKGITMFEGSSIDEETISRVKEFAGEGKKIMVILDSNHTHEHVLAELNAYAPLVSKDSYCVVFDTAVEDLPDDYDWGPRSWGKGNNPKTAVHEFLKDHPEFEIDQDIQNKLLITVAPDGYLKRVK